MFNPFIFFEMTAILRLNFVVIFHIMFLGFPVSFVF